MDKYVYIIKTDGIIKKNAFTNLNTALTVAHHFDKFINPTKRRFYFSLEKVEETLVNNPHIFLRRPHVEPEKTPKKTYYIRLDKYKIQE